LTEDHFLDLGLVSKTALGNGLLRSHPFTLLAIYPWNLLDLTF